MTRLQPAPLTRRAFLGQTALTAAAITSPALRADCADSVRSYPTGALAPVSVIRQRAHWKRFIILVWQFQNDVRQDAALYDAAGLHGFHIDRDRAKRSAYACRSSAS